MKNPKLSSSQESIDNLNSNSPTLLTETLESLPKTLNQNIKALLQNSTIFHNYIHRKNSYNVPKRPLLVVQARTKTLNDAISKSSFESTFLQSTFSRSRRLKFGSGNRVKENPLLKREKIP